MNSPTCEECGNPLVSNAEVYCWECRQKQLALEMDRLAKIAHDAYHYPFQNPAYENLTIGEQHRWIDVVVKLQSAMEKTLDSD